MITHSNRIVAFLAFDGINLLDIAGPFDAFTAANRLAGDGQNQPYKSIVVSIDGGPIETFSGLPIVTTPIAALADLSIDTLIVPGGGPVTFPPTPADLVAWIADRHAGIRRICSVCTGAFLLADAGLLAGRRVATHWMAASLLQSRHPDLQVEPEPIFICEGSIWTSAGVTAGIDLALALIEVDLGHAIALQVARRLVVFLKRQGGQSQFSVPLANQIADDGTFNDLHAWIASHFAEELNVERLAEQAKMSSRNFSRIYAAKTGTTPAKMVASMRLEAACRAVVQTRQPIKRIASDYGLGTERTLRRIFLRHFGLGPLEYRQRFSKSG